MITKEEKAEKLKNFQTRVGEVIKKYRIEKNLTQKEVSFTLGYSSPACCNWERGIATPESFIICDLCELLDIPIEEYFEKPSSEPLFSQQEISMILKFRNLQPSEQKLVIDLLKALSTK